MQLISPILRPVMMLALLWGFAKSDPLHGLPDAELRRVGQGNLYFVALIREIFSGKHLCTGALISRNQVLTAATCLENYSDSSKLRVTFGSTGRAFVRKDYIVVSKLTYQDWCSNHPTCTWDVYTNDISILRLNVADTSITPVLVDYSYKFESGDKLKVIGWGTTNKRSHSSAPKRGMLEILSKQDCEDRVRKTVRSCFSNFELPQQVSCAASDPAILGGKGDFGGPVLRGDHRRGNSILGILIQRCPSFGDNDFNPNQVNLILQLSAFEQFIQEAIGK